MKTRHNKNLRRTSLVLGTLFVLVGAFAVGRENALANFVINAWQGYKLTQGLVGYWTFDGKDVNWATGRVSDVSGQVNDGAMTGLSTSTSPVLGKTGQGLSFNGSTGYIYMGDPTILDGVAEMSASIWFKTSDLATERHLFEKSACSNSSNTTFEVYGGAVSGKMAVAVRSGGVNTYIDGATSYNDGNWHLAVMRYDGATLKLYIDGREDASTPATGAVASAADTLAIGGYCSGNGLWWNGQADEARIYNRALSLDEIRRLYLMGASTKTNISHRDELTNGLRGYWTMDGKDSTLTTVLDRGSQGNTGTITGATKKIGKIGQALDFNGTTDTVSTAQTQDFESTNMTVSAWIYPRTTGEGAFGMIASIDNFSGTSKWAYSLCSSDASECPGTANTIELWTHRDDNSDAYWYVSQANAIKLNEWNHVAFTFTCLPTTNDPKMYINGVSMPVAEGLGPTGGDCTEAINKGLYIGSDPSNVNTFDGMIDEFRYYNRVLSADEVKRLYLMGASMKVNVSHRDELTNGLVGYWTMDGKNTNWNTGTTDDSSGNGTTMHLMSMSTTTSPTIGKIGQAFTFDDTASYLVNSSVSSALNITGDITMSVWLKRSSAAIGTYGGIVSKGTDSVAGDYEIYIEGSPHVTNVDNVGFYTDAGGGTSVFNNTPITDTNWHHVVFTRTAGVSAFYLDGIADGGAGLAVTFPNAATTVSIGTDGPTYLSGASMFGGSIDEVRIYNRGLSIDEIKRLYLMGH